MVRILLEPVRKIIPVACTPILRDLCSEFGCRSQSIQIAQKFSKHAQILRMTGLEPARRKHQNLNLARLPIPPHPHIHAVNSQPASTLIMIRDILILVKHLFLTNPFLL